ncbi:MAG: helix-turn-helix transcriptional regulator [Actinomycetota bacterium]|nr:helix-turn-helix transcriptional regulator [Actinomycetota bacterium]
MTTRSAEVRRAEAKVVYDAFLATCPTRQVLATIGDKWSSLLIAALSTGPRRHSELRNDVGGVSQKMLTQTLRELERDGLVARTVTAQVPVRVDYALSDLGQTLVPVLRALKDWAETHIEEVLAARERYDAIGSRRTA